MPETAGMSAKKAPAVGTHYDMGAPDSAAEYYKLRIAEIRMANASNSLNDGEKQALKLSSDLDVLTVKILVKLKLLPDFHPELNTMRAITGMESREDIARELAVKHYNKAVVDRFVKKYVSVDGANSVLDTQQTGARSAAGVAAGYEANFASDIPSNYTGMFNRPLLPLIASLAGQPASGGGGGAAAAAGTGGP